MGETYIEVDELGLSEVAVQRMGKNHRRSICRT
jgi:hypothetical protein